MKQPRHVLVAGVSARAPAESAVRAGFTVTALDAFGDADQAPGVRALSLPRDFGRRFTAQAAARAAGAIPSDAVSYLSSFENHPRAVASLSRGRTLWGNPPAVLERVRDPWLLAEALRRRSLATPEVARASPDSRQADWLVKPLGSGGGHGIRRWTPGQQLPRRCYLQERIDGTPGSVVFVADRQRAVPLGVSRQLVGDAAFGAEGFRYCGNILPGVGRLSSRLRERAYALAAAVVDAFGLVGVNAIDFIARDDVPYAIEVNPRWSGSVELVERASDLSVFAVHAAACAHGALPAVDNARNADRAIGKAIVFARHDVTIHDPSAWLADPWVRDVPHAGESIRRGHPVCTVFASGEDEDACYRALEQRAAGIYAALVEWQAQPAIGF